MSAILCSPCQNENEDVTAAAFCQECEEHLCDNCLRYHGRLSGTKSHNVIKRLESAADKTEEAKVKEPCPFHDDQTLEYFCVTHDQFSCEICKTQVHNKCKDVQTIFELVNQTDIDEEYRRIVNELDELQSEVRETAYEVKVSFKAVQLNYKDATSYLVNTRKKVDNYLGKLQNSLQDQIEGYKEGDSKKLHTFADTCKTINRDIDSTKVSFHRMKIRKDRVGLFTAMKSSKSRASLDRRNLSYIRANNLPQRYRFKPYEFITQFSLGSVDSTPDAIKTATLVKSLNVRLESEKESFITGIQILDTHKIAIVDNRNKSLKMIDIPTDTILSSITLETPPWGVAFLGKLLCVTLPESQMIAQVDVRDGGLKLLQEKEIKVNGKCYSIATYDGNILVSFCDPTKIEMFNDSGNSLRVFEVSVTNSRYIAVDPVRKVLFISDSGKIGTITTLSLQDTNNDVKLDMPTEKFGAITTDRTGTLFYGFCPATMSPSFGKVSSTGGFGTGTSTAFGIGSASSAGKSKLGASDGKYVSVCQYSKDKKQSHCRLLNGINATSLSYCNDTNRLFVGTDGTELHVHYVV